MCGRYALALRPSQVRARLQNERMPVDDAPDDPPDDDDDQEAYRQQHGPRQSYNFAPGYHGLVYRADTPHWGAGAKSNAKGDGEPEEADLEVSEDQTNSQDVHYKLQSMKWGLVPFWTKRNPDYGSLMRTINCRDDSLIENRGMWTSMKQKKRCVIIAQGFYEWLKKGKEKVPHYVKRKDGQLMCCAGLWDCVQYEGSEDMLYTYTIITTSSNKQLNFLHDRMPVILDNGSKDLETWLDPKRTTWSKELQSLLKPFDGELEVYPVSKEVGKVGNNSPNFIIPVASSENKSNIANFFAKGPPKDNTKDTNEPSSIKDVKQEPEEDRSTVDHEGTEDNAPLPVPKDEVKKGVKRELSVDDVELPPNKFSKASDDPSDATSTSNTGPKKKSATTNIKPSPKKPVVKEKGMQNISNFFKK